MVNSWYRFCVVSLVGFYGGFVLLACLNIVVDPYRIFKVVPMASGYTPNQRFNKIEFLLANPDRYDSFLVGSSKVGLLNPDVASELRPGHQYYNLGVFGGDAVDALLMLRHLKAQGVKVREVTFGLDLQTFMSLRKEETPAYRHHPKISNQSWLAFWSQYLFIPSLNHSFLKVFHDAQGGTEITFDITGNGAYHLPAFEAGIKSDSDGYIKKHFPANPPIEASRTLWLEERFIELRELVSWLDAEGVTRFIFVNPHYFHGALSAIDAASLSQFYSKVEAITGAIPSFIGHKDWDKNKALYYEPEHYRPILGEEMFREIYSES
jgi:hypothetical protein